MKIVKPVSIGLVQETNKSNKIDQVIGRVTNDLKRQSLSISKIAVWQVRSQSAGIDVDLLHAKLINELVSSNSFQVISRHRLEELLKEQELALSGIMDEKSAVEIGGLIGVEGFLDGYAALENNQLSLTLHLIETKTGKILWSTTAQSE
ncbi:MAG: hypothetical protein H8E64_08495 [Candidatus Marinimicrobia bacterium]|nr:hypothetical protein [Candidatus Neomarinimicrobiota bacterium]